MSVRCGWSTDSQDALTFAPIANGRVIVRHIHIDDMDADFDRDALVGEFQVADLQRALIGPKPARAHVANKQVNPLQAILRRWMRGAL